MSSRTSSHSPKRRRSGSADRKGISNPSDIFYNHNLDVDLPDVRNSNDDVLDSIDHKDMTDSLDLDKNSHKFSR